MSDGLVLQDALKAGAQRQGGGLAAETALFLLLEIAESLGDTPLTIDATDVAIDGEGGVAVLRRRACTEPAAVLALAQLAEQVLSPVPTGVRAMLLRAHAGEITTLLGLRIELEALLVPLNRGAARRVLGRWVRETQKHGSGAAASAVDTAPEAAPTTASATDTQPDDVPPFPRPASVGDLASLNAMRVGRELETIRGPSSATDTVSDAPRAARPPADATDPEGAPSGMPTSDVPSDVPDAEASSRPPAAPSRSRTTRWIALLLLLAAFVALYAYRTSRVPESTHHHYAP